MAEQVQNPKPYRSEQSQWICFELLIPLSQLLVTYLLLLLFTHSFDKASHSMTFPSALASWVLDSHKWADPPSQSLFLNLAKRACEDGICVLLFTVEYSSQRLLPMWLSEWLYSMIHAFLGHSWTLWGSLPALGLSPRPAHLAKCKISVCLLTVLWLAGGTGHKSRWFEG